MRAHENNRDWIAVVVFAFVLITSSIDVFKKYTGYGGMAVYSVVVVCVVVLAYKLISLRYTSLVSDRTILVLVAMTFVALIAITLVVFPAANSGAFGGGSDADDALRLAATEILNGRYPYYPLTYLGNPIAPMPGSVILAIPFVAFGLLPLQNIFWLGVFFFILRREAGNRAIALLLFWLMMALSPAVFQNLVTATDRTTNAIVVLTGMWILIRTVPIRAAPNWTKVGGAVLLGVGLSSRSNFIFVAPLIFSVLLQNAGWREALKYSLLAGISTVAITLPFYLYDPAGFTPLSTQAGKMAQFETQFPFARIWVPVTGLLFAGILARKSLRTDGNRFFWYCALTQMFSVFLLSAISTLYSGDLDLYLGHVSYGVFFLFFTILAAAIWLRKALNATNEVEELRRASNSTSCE